MNDRQYRDQKARVNKYIHKWRDILGLWKHRINVIYERQYHSDNDHTEADCGAAWHYKSHRITFYLPEIAKLSGDDEVEEVVVHELAHILIHAATGDTYGKSDAEREKVEYATSNTAFALIWAYNEGVKSVKTKV